MKCRREYEYIHTPRSHKPGRLLAIGTVMAALSTLLGLEGLTGLAWAGGVDIPTGFTASPLGPVVPFKQQMLRFEEFGTQPLPAPGSTTGTSNTLPPPVASNPCGGQPDTTKLDNFLSQPLHPTPTEMANITDPNPWAATILGCIPSLGAGFQGVMEGRPPGISFAHQRWSEFFPQEYFQSAQAGARINGGFRDNLQRHQYAAGEFGPALMNQEGHTGLYHNTVGPDPVTGVIDHQFDGSTKGIAVKLRSIWPTQDPLALWTFDGTFPPKLLMARYGVPLLFRHYNALPIDIAANRGFGEHTITTHEHNGHTPAESDGFFNSYFFPGEYYDYRWPIQLAGHDTINTNASHPRAATPCSPGEVLMIDGIAKTCEANGTVKIAGDWHETMSTHWFHDHMIDRTAQNVYKGNAAMMNYYSAIDRGKEGFNCNYTNSANPNLCLPSGTALDWGNRDYDVNLLVADKAVDAAGQLTFNTLNLDGFLGDLLTVNWLYKPYLDVRARRYRFRILNGSVSRFFKIAVVREFNDATSGSMPGPINSGKSYSRVPFHMIANDGNIMQHAVPFPNAQSQDLPIQGIAERYDIVVDFSQFAPGTKLYLVNTLEHADGTGPKGIIPLAQILDGTYAPTLDGNGFWKADPAVSKFLELRVQAYDGTDLSMNPADYELGKKQMIPLVKFTDAQIAGAVHHTFEFGKGGGDPLPWSVATDGGAKFNADPTRVAAAPKFNQLQIWHLINAGGGWAHPIHIHFEEGQILLRGNGAEKHIPPVWEVGARKDVYRISPLGKPDPITGVITVPDSSMQVDVLIRFREFAGTFMEHCHNTQHEDNAMLVRWDNEHPNQTVRMETPSPTWSGVNYIPTTTLPTAVTGDAIAAATFVPPRQLTADMDKDGIVSLSDYLTFRSQYRLRGLYDADLDEDEIVGLSDYLSFRGQYRQTTGYAPAPAP